MPGGAQDAAPRLRRQGAGGDPGARRGRARRGLGSAASRWCSRPSCASTASSRSWPSGGGTASRPATRSSRTFTPAASCGGASRPRRACPRRSRPRPSRMRGGFWTRSATSGFWPSSSSRSAIASSPTRWPRASTTRGTGPSRARRRASSRTTCGRLRACRSVPTAPRGASAMLNLIGAVPDAGAVLAIPGAHLHLYGKAARPGRKLGHVTLRADGATRARPAARPAGTPDPAGSARRCLTAIPCVAPIDPETPWISLPTAIVAPRPSFATSAWRGRRSSPCRWTADRVRRRTGTRSRSRCTVF